jgi:two-component system, NarL family, sensor kinase
MRFMTAMLLHAPATTLQRARLIAVGVAALGGALAVAGLALAIANAGTPLPEGTNWRVAHAGAVAFVAFGALLAIRLPGNAVSWIALAVGVSQALAQAANEWAVHALLVEDGAAGGAFAQWLASWVWLPGYALVPTLLLLLFPTGRPPSPRWRALIGACGVVIALTTAWFAVVPYADLGEPVLDPAAARPLTSAALADVLAPAGLLLIPCVAACAASVLVRLRGAGGDERQQLRWFGAGVAVALLCLLAGQTIDGLGPAGLATAQIVLPAAISVAIVRHGLWELGPLARRSVVYGVLSVAALAVYGLAVLVLGGGNAIATVLVAVVLLPLHARIGRAVNRLLYGDRDEPWAAARRLGERLTAPGDPLEEIGRALRLPLIELRDHAPATGDRLAAVPLVFAGERVGVLVAGGRELGPADRRALAELAPPLAAAVHAARLAEDLRRSRERLVAAREEERRRLRHDLHDEVGPSLAILALRLDAEGRDELAAQARADLARIRAIVRDLRPAALDDLGLAGALAQEIDAVRAGGLDARLDASAQLGSLPAGVEVAAYRIAREALANVVRHAGASRCVLALHRTGLALSIAVEDDGRGIPGGAAPRVGLASMRARAEELGGSFEIAPGPRGGTRIYARLPL